MPASAAATGARARRCARAHGDLLASEGHHEDAVEEFLRAGELGRARCAAAERAIAGVIERLDLAVAERWLARSPTLAPAAGR